MKAAMVTRHMRPGWRAPKMARREDLPWYRAANISRRWLGL